MSQRTSLWILLIAALQSCPEVACRFEERIVELETVINFKKTKVFTISITISMDKFESVASSTYPVLRNCLFNVVNNVTEFVSKF